MARVTEEQVKANQEKMKKSKEQAEKDPSSSLASKINFGGLRAAFEKAGLRKKKEE